MQQILDTLLRVDYCDKFLEPAVADELLLCVEQLDFTPNKRSTILFGDEGLIYSVTYHGHTSHHKTINWASLPILLPLKSHIEQLYKHTFNFCAIMKYPNGDTVIGKHRDKEMVAGSTICGISVGVTRRLQLSPPGWLNQSPHVLNLTHGSLYALLPPTNDKWLHEILKDTTTQTRYSLTFRNLPTDILITEIPVYPKCKGQYCLADIKDDKTRCLRHR
jgi:hypothetical protein